MGLGRAGGLVAAAMAVALGGCGIDKVDEHGRQLNVIGDVEIATSFCTSSDTDEHSRACAAYSFPHRGQLLVAYRVPSGSPAPDSLADDGGVRHFTPSSSYTDYMEATYPEDGMHWAGYVSEPYSTAAGDQYAFALSPEFALPDAGKPFAGPFRYQVVAGYRALTDAAEGGSAPVDCSDTITTSCTSSGVAEEDSSQPTRDLAVLPGGEVPVVEPGGHVALPFDLRFAGSGGDGVRFDLASSAGTVSRQTLEPAADSENAISVDVPVPAGTPAGVYEVSLTAAAVGEGDVIIHKARAGRLHVGGVETRTGTMTYRVVDPPPPAPPDPPVAPPPDPAPPQTETPPTPAPIPVPLPVDTPRAVRAKLALSLDALPRRAYSGSRVSYRVVVWNLSAQPAVRARVCIALPSQVQLVRAPSSVRFSGSELCFDRKRLRPGAAAAERVVVHIDVDARAGMTHARATASAANAVLVRAHARMRVIRRPCPPRHVPVTG